MKFIVREKDREYEFLLAPGLYIVGRDPTCDLTLDSKSVSRRHVSCRVTAADVTLSDLGSRNGIHVGGLRVESATLKDSDTVRVGDVELVFRGGEAVGEQPFSLPAGQAEEAAGAALEPRVEDEEQTPADGALLPAQATGAGPQLLQRQGRWFVQDPASGREVEIVPAEQARAGKPLLSTRRGKLIVGGLALVVALIFAAVLVGGSGSERAPVMPGDEYDRLIGRALSALEKGDTGRAEQLASEALAGRPEKAASKIVLELARLWARWQRDFFAHWTEVDAELKELSRLYRHDVHPRVEEFVQTYRQLIQKEIEHSQSAHRARAALDNGQYEQAWQELLGIPEWSAVRERDADLVRTVRDRLHPHLEVAMKLAASRQDWAVAREAAAKLAEYYPEQAEKMAQTAAMYADFEGHAARIRSAKEALAQKNYEGAKRALGGIPQDSPYHEEALRHLQRAEADEQYSAALDRYTGGDAPGALEMLRAQDTQAARSLQRHVQSVMDLHRSAGEAQQEKDFLKAEQLWLSLVELETDAQNAYRRQASAELDRMPARRHTRARQLAAEADRQYRQEQLERARDLYEKAAAMDPDSQIGRDALRSMRERGRMDFRRGVNLVDRNPRRALELLTRACRLLPADDRYYQWACERKEEVEQGLRNP